jgi:hypothetical protein
MNILSQEELKQLVNKRGDYCLSFYMPTHHTSPDTKEDPIRLKNLLREAEQRLKKDGVRVAEVKQLLIPATSLIKNTVFWQYQSDGLAVFISHGFFRYYRLPISFKELLVITDHFHLKPLLRLFSNDGRFHILALSQNEVRLFQCTRYSFSEIDLGEIPRSMAEALKYDDTEKQLQRAEVGSRTGVFHGQGAGIDDVKNNILRFFQQIDHGLKALLHEDKSPVVLAGVEYLFPIYKEANSFLNLMEKGISGNPEGVRAEDLHNRAWKIMEPYFLKNQQLGEEQYKENAGNGKTSTDVKEIVEAAFDGRIEILFVAMGIEQWGTFEPSSRVVHHHEEANFGDEDLLDLAAVNTFLNGGKVFVVEPEKLPEKSSMAAVFRY